MAVTIAKRDLITLLGGACVASWPREALFGQSMRDSWLYDVPQGRGVFRWSSGHQWVESTPAGDTFLFEERAPAHDSLDLYDAGRRLSVRLNASFGEWREDPSPTWHRWYNGRFVPPDQVPVESDYRIRVAYFVPRDRQ